MASGTVKRGAVLLWTNAHPTSSFSAQTIPLALSEYDAVKVVFAQSTSSQTTGIVVEAVKGIEGRAFTMYNARYYRGFTWSDTGVTFTTGSTAGRSSDMSNDASIMIPLKIYGVRW